MPVSHSEEKYTHANGITVAYDTFGEPAASPMLLIMGLGAQMISWDEAFCSEIAARHYHVIRFDNRDVGHSTRFEETEPPDLLAFLQAWQDGKTDVQFQAAYDLEDMARDAIGLLDALQLDSVHVVGLSLGGMIAQVMAIHFPGRVRTLTSIMSMTGDLAHWSPRMEALSALLAPPPPDREAYIQHGIQSRRVFNGPFLPFDEERARARSARSFDRGISPGGAARQVAAMLASLGWKTQLAAMKAPTLVIHGDADPLVPLAGGVDTAKSIPGAKLLVIPGLGHALPPQVWPQIIDAIAAHATD